MSEAEITPLSERKIAVIGCGSMGTALVKGMSRSDEITAKNIHIFDLATEQLETLASDTGVTACSEAGDATLDADLIILAVKPGVVEGVFDSSTEFAHWISIAASCVSCCRNPCCTVGSFRRRAASHCARDAESRLRDRARYYQSFFFRDADLHFAEQVFATTGSTLTIDKEEDLDSVTGLSGSGPAYVALFLEAMVDGGVRIGLNRSVAEKLAIETLRGAASLLIEKQMTPAELKYQVSSPGGTTIAGLHILEKAAVRGSIISAVEAATKRSKEQGK